MERACVTRLRATHRAPSAQSVPPAGSAPGASSARTGTLVTQRAFTGRGSSAGGVSAPETSTPAPSATATGPRASASGASMTRPGGTVKNVSQDFSVMLWHREILEIPRTVSPVSAIHSELFTRMRICCLSVTPSQASVPVNQMLLAMTVRNARMVSGILTVGRAVRIVTVTQWAPSTPRAMMLLASVSVGREFSD